MQVEAPKKSREELEKSIKLFLFLDCIAFLCDLTSAYFSNSLALSSEVIRTLIEVVAIFISLILIKNTHKQNQSYTYGLGKLENLGSIIIALSLIISFYFITHHALIRLREPGPLHGVELGLLFNSLYFVKNIWFYQKLVRIVKGQPNSPLVEAQKRAYLICSIINAGLVINLSLNYLFPSYKSIWLLDSLTSLLIACFILFTAFQTISHSFGDLIDKALNENAQQIITQALVNHSHLYNQYHGMRSRQSGDKRYVDIFLEFDGHLLMADVQNAINLLKEHIEDELPGGVVSIIPSNQRILTL